MTVKKTDSSILEATCSYRNRSEAKLGHPYEPQIEKINITLLDVLAFLKKNALTLFVAAGLGLVAGLSVYAYLPKKWDAAVTLQVGKIPVMQSLIYISPPTEVLEKLRSPSFLFQMLSSMYGKNAASDPLISELLYKDLKVSLVKGSSDLIVVRVFGRTANEAYKNAEILAEHVITEHRAMAAPYIANLERRQLEVVENIERSQDMLTRLSEMEQSSPSRNASTTLLKVALIDAKASEIQKLKMEQARLDEILSIANLQPTKLVGRSLAPEVPSSPKFAMLTLAGTFLGLFVGCLVSLLSLLWRHGLGSFIRA